MSYTFEGLTYITLKAWADRYPAYARHTDLLKAGAKTVQEIEQLLRVRSVAGRARSQAAAKKNQFSIVSKTGQRFADARTKPRT